VPSHSYPNVQQLPAIADERAHDPLDRRDPKLIRALLPTARFLNRYYLRLRVDGREHIPRVGPALFVANHNGGIAGPDLLCTMVTLLDALGPEAPLYALAHDAAMARDDALARWLGRLGCLRAAPANALNVLQRGGKILVYPGGDLEAYRHSRERERIILGPRSGFARVAQEAGAPIVPIVAQGAHRSAYIFDDGAWIARALHLQRRLRIARFPLAFALPYGLAIGPYLPYFPLPFRIRLRILPAIAAPQGADPHALREHVRDRMQAALSLLAEEK
jgi:1-acyl-sn-glycerol-3-phosphate acyltransferase